MTNTDRNKFDGDLVDYSATSTSTLARKGKARGMTQTCLGFSAAASAALLAGTDLEAGIMYSGVQNATLSFAGGTTAGFYLDLSGGSDFQIFHSFGFLQFAGLNGALLATNIGGLKNFSSGQTIGTSGSNFASGNSVAIGAGAFPLSSPGFAGIKFGTGNYGWIRIHMGTPAPGMTVVDWAYDNMGNHIQAGAIPEPALATLMGLGLLSMGAAGLRKRRTRKRDAETTTSDL